MKFFGETFYKFEQTVISRQEYISFRAFCAGNMQSIVSLKTEFLQIFCSLQFRLINFNNILHIVCHYLQARTLSEIRRLLNLVR